MNGPQRKAARRNTAVRRSRGVAVDYCSRRLSLDHVRAHESIQQASVMSDRLRLAVLGSQYVSTWSPRPSDEPTHLHHDRVRYRRNDFSLHGASVDQKTNQACPNLPLIIRRRQHHAEGSSH
jgi:hypothetical protein